MLEFTAIDFETANRYADSACSLAAVSIAGQAVMHEGYTLIKPPFNRFDEDNIRIHGITPQWYLPSRPLTLYGRIYVNV